MPPNPKPNQVVAGFDGQRVIVKSNPRGPEPPRLFEMQRWMRSLLLEQCEVFVS